MRQDPEGYSWMDEDFVDETERIIAQLRKYKK